MNIRPFKIQDYPAIISLWNVTYPENQLTVEDLKRRDDHHEEKLLFQRYVLEEDERIIGYGHHDQRNDEYHPQKFVMFLCLEEAAAWSTRQMLGKYLLKAIEPYNPIAVYCIAREDMPNARLYPELGFKETSRTWESRLDPQTLDLSQIQGAISHIEKQGYLLRSLKELATDPHRDQKLYEFLTTVEQDIPRTEPYTPPSFESFREEIITHPDMIPESYIVALHDSEYVGVSSIWQRSGNDYLETDITGVRRDHRQKGLAFALKLKALSVIRDRQKIIKTWNNTANHSIIKINNYLGFVRQPPWIDFVKETL